MDLADVHLLGALLGEDAAADGALGLAAVEGQVVAVGGRRPERAVALVTPQHLWVAEGGGEGGEPEWSDVTRRGTNG